MSESQVSSRGFKNVTGLSSSETDVLARIVPGELVDLLNALIKQRSDYPPGDCRSVIKIVSDKLENENIPYQIFAQQKHQPNLISYIGNPELRPHLTLHSHIDTVPPGDIEQWAIDPFAGELIDGSIYGRGAGDDKSSVAAQVMALLTLARASLPLQGHLQLVVVSDEESGGLHGTRFLHKEGMLATDALVVGEQTGNRVAIAERVACGIDLIVYGESAHGATPWIGDNAVLKTARAIIWLQDRLFPILEARRHPYLPPPTLNIGKIKGGSQWNIVPEWCKVEMDRRLIPGETRELAMEEIRRLLDEFSKHTEPLQYELISSGDIAANIDTPPDDEFVRLARRALYDLTNEQRPLTGYVHSSDGRWFARDGIPIIIFGPSDPAVAHAADEHVSTEQLVEATQFLTLFAMRWLGIS